MRTAHIHMFFSVPTFCGHTSNLLSNTKSLVFLKHARFVRNPFQLFWFRQLNSYLVFSGINTVQQNATDLEWPLIQMVHNLFKSFFSLEETFSNKAVVIFGAFIFEVNKQPFGFQTAENFLLCSLHI